MTHKIPARNQAGPFRRKGGIMRKMTPSFLVLFFVIALPFLGYPATPTYPIAPDAQVFTTREHTVQPNSITDNNPEPLTIKDVGQYAARGYSSWTLKDGVDAGPRLLPDITGTAQTPVEPLLHFFTITDIHITDKESPAQIVYPGTVAPFGNTNSSAYSPVILSTTHVLDATMQTINVLHGRKAFDLGMGLGDAANNTQYNELRWYIDTIDGKRITPSSGAHAGATGANSVDYQRPYQTAGLDKSIPFYQVIGNHDQWWCGTLAYTDYVRKILVSNTVLDIDLLGAAQFPTFDARGYYVGTIDGTTEFGTIINAGTEGSMAPPIVVPDSKRRSLTTNTSTTLNWMKEFFKTTSKPKGHGFTQENLDRDWTSYTFEPKANVPVKIIALDDTCKLNPYAMESTYARGCLDQARYDWLVNELELGQAQGKLMIIAAHIPVGPQSNVPDAPVPANAQTPDYPNNTVLPLFLSTCNITPTAVGAPCPPPADLANNDPVPPYSVVTDASLLETLHNYSNVILWISGHRHINTVSPQPAPAGKGPEFGFWEVETASLRDFPQGFRTFEIVRNAENTVSIIVTNVDPAVQGTGSPAEKSRGYAIGAKRIVAGLPGEAFTDPTPHVYNAELIKTLPAPYTMTVNVTGTGTVAMGPYQAATCAVGAPCTAKYLPGTQVTLAATPTPASGAVFAGWSACPGRSTCNMTMTGDVTVTATFTKAPTVVVTPTYKNFGTVKTGKKATATFRVKNITTQGIADLTINGAPSIVGADAGQFTVVAGKDRCSGQTLKPNKTCTFQVSFMPTSTNSKSAAINIGSNDPNTPSSTQIWGAGK